MECAFDFGLDIMSAIWILDENRKCCDHINGILTESFIQTSGERFTYVLEPMLYIFCTGKNILSYISLMLSIMKIV